VPPRNPTTRTDLIFMRCDSFATSRIFSERILL
jgi:hypothetical protein